MGNVFPSYQIAKANEYIVKTGLKIDNIAISKKTMKWPFQTVSRINVMPLNYEFKLEAMSSEKLEFLIPCTWTIGPKLDTESLVKFATLMSDPRINLAKFIESIIEGETRVITAGQSIESIFNNRNIFKEDITRGAAKDLDQFGMFIYNANIKELDDVPGSEYFVHIRKKAIAEAKNNAIISVAGENYKGEIFEAETERNKRIRKAELETEYLVYENEKKVVQSKSTADTAIKQSQYAQEQGIANAESVQNVNIRTAELQRDLESVKILQNTEKLKSELFSKANVEALVTERTAAAMKYKANQETDAELYKLEQIAAGNKYKVNQETEAELYRLEQIAAGNFKTLEMQANGLKELYAVHGDGEFILKYLLIETGQLEKLARVNAEAIQGLQPKINYWNTGSGVGNPLMDLAQNIPPLLDVVFKQNGLKPPSFLGTPQ